MGVVRLGIDALRDSDFAALEGRRVGLLTNLSATDSQLTPTYQLFTQAPQVQLAALFAPEHGLFGMQADGELIRTQVDPRGSIPVYSLYGEHFTPAPHMLDGLDVLVCDIQDIGVRYYTFMATVIDAARAVLAQSKQVMVLDRPNPLGGMVWGAPIEARLFSLVGAFDAPTMHGLTLGEALRLLMPEAALEIIPVEGWRRSMRWAETGLPWVPSSPAMAHLSALAHYPGSCLIEGTNLSEGRGTALPFEITGAPYIDDPFVLAGALNAEDWPGVRFRPHVFKPSSSKYADQVCSGVQAHIVAPERFDPLRTWLGVISVTRAFYPDAFGWMPPLNGVRHFDRLIGSEAVRAKIDAGAPLDELMAGWDASCAAFETRRQPALLYPE